jgi:hypothetical protein
MGNMGWIAYLVDGHRRAELIAFLKECGFTHPVRSADEFLEAKNSLVDDGICQDEGNKKESK